MPSSMDTKPAQQESSKKQKAPSGYEGARSNLMKRASHLPDRTSAGFGTLACARLSRLHRAGPSASLDKSVVQYSVVS